MEENKKSPSEEVIPVLGWSDDELDKLEDETISVFGGDHLTFEEHVAGYSANVAVAYLERGFVDFPSFALHMGEFLCGYEIMPYVRGAYNGAREWIEIKRKGIDKRMSSREEVRDFNLKGLFKEIIDGRRTKVDETVRLSTLTCSRLSEYYLLAGVRSFKVFSALLLRDIGSVARYRMVEAYEWARKLPSIMERGIDREMDPMEVVYDLRVDDFDFSTVELPDLHEDYYYFDPDFMTELCKAARRYLGRRITRFKEFALKMHIEYGDDAVEYIKPVYDMAREWYFIKLSGTAARMSPHCEVDATDLDALLYPTIEIDPNEEVPDSNVDITHLFDKYKGLIDP